MLKRAKERSAENTALCTSRNGYQITVIADYLLLWYYLRVLLHDLHSLWRKVECNSKFSTSFFRLMSSGRVLFLPKGTALRNQQLVGTYHQLGAWVCLTRQWVAYSFTSLEIKVTKHMLRHFVAHRIHSAVEK